MSNISDEKMRNCINLFMKTDRLRKKCVDRKIIKLGIHHSQHMMLMYLARHRDIANQRDIAKIFDISPAAVAVTIKKLESNGYITRNSSKADNRFNEVRITEKGLDIVKNSKKTIDYLDKKSFEKFSDDEIDQLVYLLNKMYNSLREEESVSFEEMA